MRPDEYIAHDALGLAQLIARGEVSATEVLEAAIAQVERLDPRLNAVVERLYDRARSRVAAGAPAGPFGGVPVLLKDMIALRGTRSTYGSALMSRYVAEETHAVAQRIEDAGLVVLGRTNTSELGLLPLTESTLHGPARNPWALDRSTGGSSGGSAAAVAAGIVPLAHGSDGGGSIRIPSSCCGVFGLKPSRGRNPRSFLDEPEGIAVEHCLSRSVRDSAALLDAIHGPLPGARYWAPPPDGTFLAAVAREPRPLRIAWTTRDHTGAPAHADCAAAVAAAAALCEQLGHRVEQAAPEIDGQAYNDAFMLLWATIPGYLCKAVVRQIKKERIPRLAMRIFGERPVFELLSRVVNRRVGPPLEHFTRRLAAIEASQTPADLWIAWNELQRASYVIGDFLQRYDLLLTPVLGAPPWRLGAFEPRGDVERIRQQLFSYASYTPIANTSGLPAMSVPLHWNEQGLPIGVQFIAPFGDEQTLLSLAGQLERAQPWADRRPPVS